MSYHTRTDWLSRREADFVTLCEQWNIQLKSAEHIAQFKWDEDQVGEVLVAIKAFLTAHAAYRADNSTANRIAKDAAMKNAKRAMRAFANSSVRYNPNMRDADKKALGVPVRDPINTIIQAPATRAMIGELKALGGFRIEIRFHDEETPARKALPYGCNGCLLNYVYGDEPVTDYDALIKTELMTRSPYPLNLNPDSGHKYLSCATRWQNNRGELGPWSDIVTVFII